MRFLLALTISLFANGMSLAYESTAIAPKEAHTYTGKTVTVHGFVGEVTAAANGDLIVRFGRPDPNHPFEAVVPQKSIATVGAPLVQNLAGKEVTIRGEVTMDKDTARITITSAEQILK